MMPFPARTELTALLAVGIRDETDIVTARQRARGLAAQLGMPNQDQVRVATAVSELARNAYQYAGSGRVEFALALQARPQVLVVTVSDEGPGISNIQTVLGGNYHSSTGMGLGLIGTRRLADRFEIDSRAGHGTVVRFAKNLPPGSALGMRDISHLVGKLVEERPGGAFDELQRQTVELLEMVERAERREADLAQRQVELTRLNQELEETNRGVVALYAELDEKAMALRRADELKSRFLSHVSHEFRTPVNSILALAHLLLRRADGDLTEEQERQVGYIRSAAQDLLEMVNDLLDLAKVESGKTEIRKARIELSQLIGALRGIMRPLAVNEAVALVFDEPPEGVFFESDEAKITQILRNLVSNALKFTERGEVRVTCRYVAEIGQLSIAVRDTGIGIDPADQDRIFQEFAQVEHPLQRKVKGTGLGLPLSRKLAHLLGGTLEVESSPGRGSRFTFTLPTGVAPVEREIRPVASQDADSILIIDDEETSRYLARHLFRGTRYRILEASTGSEGAERARFELPKLILLDLVMPDRNGFDVLDDLKSDPATRDIPVIIHTSRRLSQADQQRLDDRHVTLLSKGEPSPQAIQTIREILGEPHLFNDYGPFEGPGAR